jgi:exonuclease SbcD
MVTIAHIADVHFDASSRWEEHLRICQWIVDHLAEVGPDIITLGGDVYERRPTPLESVAAARWVMDLADIAPVVVVYGNHDVAGCLDVLPYLRAAHPIQVASRPTTLRFPGIDLHCLPWPRRGDLLAAAEKAPTVEGASDAASEALRAILRGFAGERRPGMPGALVGHVMVRGSVVSTGQPVAPGTDFELGVEGLALARADAYLLGHIHMAQGWTTADGAPVLYPGSPRRTTWGELEPKGFSVVTLGGGEVGVSQTITPTTPMLHVEGTFDGVDTIRVDHQPTSVAGAEIRLRYNVPADARAAGRAAARVLRDWLIDDGASAVHIQERVLANVTARAPEVVRATSIADKLSAMWSARGEAPERTARMRTMLRTLEEGTHEV